MCICIYIVLVLRQFKIYSNFAFFSYFVLFLDIGQQTNPPELPIFGDPFTEIALDLVFPKGNPIFLLNGKKLQLLQPLDRDEENLSHIVFQVSKHITVTEHNIELTYTINFNSN